LFGSEENKWREKKWIVMWWWMRIKEVDDEWNGMEWNGILGDGLYLSATCIFFLSFTEVFLFQYCVWIIEVAVFITTSLLLDLELFYFIF
jgi:hypothetical protein